MYAISINKKGEKNVNPLSETITVKYLLHSLISGTGLTH